MYILLIALHTVFFIIAYLLWNILMQIAFVILLLFFLLYFSPLFFSQKKIENHSHTSGEKEQEISISPKKSILIPLILTYAGIYILAFTVQRDMGSNFTLHLYILLLIFLLFCGYIFAFDWDTVFFWDAMRFHLLISYMTIFAHIVYFFIVSPEILSIHILFCIVTIVFSYFFFTRFRDESVPVFLTALMSGIVALDIGVIYLIWDIHILTLFGITILFIIALFEIIPRLVFFDRFLEESRMLLLTTLLLLSIILMMSPVFGYFHFVYFLPVSLIFLYSIHMRYCNYISYSVATVLVFFLYTYLFLSLLQSPVLIENLLFVFFFPLCIIANTYFWEERYPYDFSLLHYAGIGFSTLTCLYSLFFVAWWSALTLFLACSLFLFALLFLLSYFRFQYH